MAIYMIRAGESGPVKLGFSNDPKKRLGELQISHWETLRIIRVFSGSLREEAQLQLRFADLHIRGEWHSFSRTMLGDVGLHDVTEQYLSADAPLDPGNTIAPTVAADAAELGERIRALRRFRRLTQAEAAASLGIARATLASIEAGHDFPGRELLLRVTAFFGVALDIARAA